MDDFWKQTLARARTTPLNVQVERVTEPVPYEKYRLTYSSLDGIRVRAYLAVPSIGERAAAPVPAIVTAPGYGGWEFGVELSECQRGYAVLQVYPRSQGESGELWKVEQAADRAWLNHGKHSPEGFYYQGAYVDVIRGIDYLPTRPDVDGNRIGVMGTSQGGGIALAVAALDPLLKAVVAHLPYLCDLRHNPAFAATDLGRDQQFLDTFEYFDPVQLAPRLRVPALLSSGGRDATSPPETIRAVFDRLAGIRSLVHYPDLTHTSCGEFYALSWEWLNRWLK